MYKNQSGHIPHSVTLGRMKHSPHSITLGCGTGYPLSVTLGRSETKTRGSRGKMNHCFSGYSCQSTNMTRMISQSGRSMVEMLGVLAVIGVLSIGGIAGYSYSMDKYRANTTINDINLRRIDLMAQTENGNNNPTLDAWNAEKTLYPMTLVFDEDTDVPLIQVSNVPEQVCEMIVEDMETQAAITVNSYYIAGQEDGGCEEENDLTFYFGDYEACGTDYCSGDKPACNLDTQTCVECLDSGDCPSDKPVCNASNVCEPCPDETPVWDGTAGQCTGCTSHDDCVDGSLCWPSYNECWGYSEHPIEGTPGWVHVKIDKKLPNIPDGRTTYKNAQFICEHLGYQLPVAEDFVPDWDGITICDPEGFAGHYSDVARVLLDTVPSMGIQSHIWTSTARGNGYQIIFVRTSTYTSCLGLYVSGQNNTDMVVCKPK